MTTAEIRGFREKLIVAATVGDDVPVKLSQAQLEFLIHILRSHIIWREWLVPGE